VYLWQVGRICEEYSCLPLAAVRELSDDPEQMAVQILELRAYARTKARMDVAKDAKDLPPGDAIVARVLRTRAALRRR
jgi:hypothetical protein